MFKSSIAIAAAILTASSTAALALPHYSPTRTVSYADLDLSTAAGRERLDRRIAAAVRDVCGKPSLVDLSGYSEMRACRTETLAQVNNQRVGQVFVTAALASPGAAGTR
ncbi:MAG: UrcA family protein [Allosphingosinicella sp.]